jgi:hypothetical protein
VAEKEPDAGEACSPDLKYDLVETDRGSPNLKICCDFNKIII